MMLQFRRPFKAPYEPIHVALTDNDTFIFRPKNASRLCLPADYANQKLLNWNQKRARTHGNPQVASHWWRSIHGIGTVIINTGNSVYTLFPDYDDPQSDYHDFNRTKANFSLDKANHKYSFEFYLDNNRKESNPNLTDGQSDENELCLYLSLIHI